MRRKHGSTGLRFAGIIAGKEAKNYLIMGGEKMGDNDLLDELTAVVGADAAERLFKYYAGSNVYFSKGRDIRRKHTEIREEFKNGASYRELGVKYGYGENYIRKIIHRKGRKNGQ
jgi:Mor family transcriptional regulator